MRRTNKGFTLAEVVIATSVTVVIGVAVAGVSVALGNLHEESEEYYEFLQTGRVAVNRLQATLRAAGLVTASSPTAMVIWARDHRDPGHINISELIGVYHDPTTNRMMDHRIVFPPEMSEDMQTALDIRVTLAQATDVDLAEGVFKLPQYDEHRVLANHVKELRLSSDAMPPMARLVKFRLKVGKGAGTVRITGGAALRADKTAYVGLVDSQYVLDIPPEHLPQDADANAQGT